MKKLLLLLGVGVLMAAAPEPQIFEAGDHTCVYIGGELECFCPCETPQICINSETSTPQIATNTPEFTATITPEVTSVVTPSATPAPICYQWMCHKTGNAGEKAYCCDSSGCASAHLGHGDYEGKCR